MNAKNVVIPATLFELKKSDPPVETVFETHMHRTCELFYFIAGEGYYTVEGTNYILTPGCVLLMRDGETHMAHINSSVRYYRATINFPIELIEEFCPEGYRLLYGHAPGKENYIRGNESSRRFIGECMNHLFRDGGDYSTNGNLLLRYLLPILTELAHAKMNPDTDNSPVISSEASEIVRNIIAYVSAHLPDITSLEDIQQKFFFSKSYINRVFKESTGSSIWNYVIKKKLLLARSLLRDGSSSSEAAKKSGFSDYSSFYKQYRKRFGVAPSKTEKR